MYLHTLLLYAAARLEPDAYFRLLLVFQSLRDGGFIFRWASVRDVVARGLKAREARLQRPVAFEACYSHDGPSSRVTCSGVSVH